MSIFASQNVRTIELPFAAPHTVTISKLPGRHLDKAEKESMFTSARNFRLLGGAEFSKELAAINEDKKKDEQLAKVASDPLNGYDVDTLLYHGIKSWTFDMPLERVLVAETNERGDKVMVSRIPAIDDMDSESREFVAREILRLSIPSLFQTKDEAEAAQGKG